MTTRIALIGTSHAAAFNSAWGTVSEDWPNAQITFFAARNEGGIGITHLEARGGKLVCDHPRLAKALNLSSGGLTEIDPAHYDAFLLVGFPPRTIHLPPVSPYSHAVRAAMYETAAQSPPLTRMRVMLQAVAPDMPVFAAAQPLFATPPNGATPASTHYAAACKAMAAHVFAPLGIQHLPQPFETVLDNQWTDPAFSRGSLRLQTSPSATEPERHPKQDRRHMNAAFGALAIAQAIPAIEASLG